MNLRLLAVHAHPDDESSKGAATLARYAEEGVDVLVATCTGGERGDVLNPALDRAEVRQDLPAVRRREMAEAARILGVRQQFLGHVDSGLSESLPDGCFARLPLHDAVEPLLELMREFRPQVVVTYDETGGYPHPDHIRTHEITRAAFEAVDNGGPRKLYYLATLSRAWFQAMHDATIAAGQESLMGPVLEELPPVDRLTVTTRIRCEQHFATRDHALHAHATQSDPAHPFFAHSRELERSAWPWEEYHLARTTLPAPAGLEEDLFAGLR
ncbi:mycothiol conjugate amidase Mca [Amycolatopsis jiangsuensis]|uniref:Mycothiol S-conjugate amidase n=1 Tax=Amycolatopsis jiangsuensis TaxID=1181879 RepID=A0A840J0B7_9PSEU|nr:mycothiol conjugate amidase Mca [Amycolatopsis jiangsuensis]MBB4687085.1 mycothiol S-conjugate amidase [Amycolatopsis jiangsuensis]